jgi:hypothetical protein
LRLPRGISTTISTRSGKQRVIFQEVDHFGPQRIVAAILEHAGSLARAWEGNREGVPEPRFRAIGHEQQPIGEVKRFVDVVGDHDYGVAGVLPYFEQRVLQVEAGEGIEHAERLIEQQIGWFERQRTRQ